MGRKNIRLFYWSSVLFEGKDQENYGDVLSQYIVEQVSGRSVQYYNAPKNRKSWFPKKHLLAIGSIMNYATDKTHVWGSGIISKKDQFGKATFHAVRGPKSRERVMELDNACPEIYGDPALLLPRFMNHSVAQSTPIGIIPHYVDYPEVAAHYKDYPDISVINLLDNDLRSVTDQIRSCQRTLSSSLHGLIVSHAYGIPSVWVRYSDKLTGDNVKFEDYLLSVDLVPYTGVQLQGNEAQEELTQILDSQSRAPSPETLNSLQVGLLNAFPKAL